MSDAEIRIVVDGDEAKRRLDEIERGLESASAEADDLDRATRRSSSTRPSSAGKGKSESGSGGVAKDLLKAAAVAAIAGKVAEAVVGAIGQELDRRGLTTLAQGLDGIGRKINNVLSLTQQIAGGAGQALQLGSAFARSGVEVPTAALGQAAQVGAERSRLAAEQAARDQQRTAALTVRVLGEGARKIASFF